MIYSQSIGVSIGSSMEYNCTTAGAKIFYPFNVVDLSARYIGTLTTIEHLGNEVQSYYGIYGGLAYKLGTISITAELGSGVQTTYSPLEVVWGYAITKQESVMDYGIGLLYESDKLPVIIGFSYFEHISGFNFELYLKL